MSTTYRSLDRGTHMMIFCASVLIAATLMGTVATAFDTLQLIVVQG